MGQSLQKLAPGNEEKRVTKIDYIIEESYKRIFADPNKKWNSADFYHAVCEIVEEINRELGSTQFRVPDTTTLRQAFDKHHQGKGKSLKREEFQQILQDVIFDTKLTGFGVKDIMLFMFGIPASTYFVKQRLAPKAIPNEIFIPVVTSATVFILASLNKI